MVQTKATLPPAEILWGTDSVPFRNTRDGTESILDRVTLTAG